MLRINIPLTQDISARFLPWIIGFMVYLAMLALAGALLLNDIAIRWNNNLMGSLTVQIPPSDPDNPNDHKKQLNKIFETLQNTEGITEVRILSIDEIDNLLEPWLGSQASKANLPIPDLIAVKYMSHAIPDLGTVKKSLISINPDVVLDDNHSWMKGLIPFADSIRLLAYILVFIITFACILTVIFVTRTGLSIHRKVVHIMHIVGAQDIYVAKQFQSHALRLGLKGGILGGSIAFLTLFGIGHFFNFFDTVIFTNFSLKLWHWVLLACLPLSMGLIAFFTARWTVLRSLEKFT
ncbi:MAG: hypothetical protein K1X44_07515 [Alphaproteobacteria bacterium]|nr:hypothetical protein [Alphaproteobacteria bacterium]